MRLQRMLGNGAWVDDDRPMFVERVIERAIGREPMTTRQQVLDYLATGKEIHYDNDWYALIRDADAQPVRTPAPVVQMVRAACGHTVARGEVMSASLGSSCEDCYDRMSG